MSYIFKHFKYNNIPKRDHSFEMDMPKLAYCYLGTKHTIPMDLDSIQRHAAAVASM